MLRVDVDERDVDAMQRRLLGDLRAHGAGADDEQTPLGNAVRFRRTHPRQASSGHRTGTRVVQLVSSCDALV